MPKTKSRWKLEGTYTVLRGYIDEHDICELLQVKQITIIRWRKLHGLPFVVIPGRIQRTVRFVLQEVMEWAVSEKAKNLPIEIDRKVLNRLNQETLEWRG